MLFSKTFFFLENQLSIVDVFVPQNFQRNLRSAMTFVGARTFDLTGTGTEHLACSNVLNLQFYSCNLRSYQNFCLQIVQYLTRFEPASSQFVCNFLVC
jgi:hypothetical protein